MAQNHEIRFGCERELINKSVDIWRAVGFDLKKSAFYKNVFVLGLTEIQKQIINQKKDIASSLLKTGERK